MVEVVVYVFEEKLAVLFDKAFEEAFVGEVLALAHIIVQIVLADPQPDEQWRCRSQTFETVGRLAFLGRVVHGFQEQHRVHWAWALMYLMRV